MMNDFDQSSTTTSSTTSVLDGYTNSAFHGDEDTIPKCLKSSDSKSSYLDVDILRPIQGQKAQEQRTKWRLRRNLLVISCGFFFLFLAFNALSSIQSSLNPDQGLGTASLSVIYGALVLSCMFIPSILIKKIGCKWTMVVSPLFYSTFVAANFYSTWGTLIPTSVLVGLAAAPLWSAHSTYLNEIGKDYAFLVGETAEIIIIRFFGFFFLFFQSGQIVGNLISSLVLNNHRVDPSIGRRQIDICGANYCNEQLPYEGAIFSMNTTLFNSSNVANITTNNTDMNSLYMLCGIYLGCALLSSLLMALFVDRLHRTPTDSSGLQLLAATFHQMKDPKQILLIPLTIYNGLEQGFMTGDFTKAMITCPLGIGKVGYVMVCHYVVDALCSIGFGPFIKKLGRIPIFTLGSLLNIGVAMVILYWPPDPNATIVFFVLAAAWGMADAIWVTQISALYGVIFHKNLEAAYSNHRLWESIGFIISFGLSNYLCTYQKLYVLLGFLAASMLGYYAEEIVLLKQYNA